MGKGNDPNCASGAAMALSAEDVAAYSTSASVSSVLDDYVVMPPAFLDDDPDQPLQYNSAELNITYIDSPEALAQCAEAIRHPDVTRIGLDIETTGGLKPWYGSTRLIQLAVERPEPRQFLIDVWAVDPSPVFAPLEDPTVEVITCGGIYEQVHLNYRYGLVLTNLFDVSYASKQIQKAQDDKIRDRAKAQIRKAEKPQREINNKLRAALRKADKVEGDSRDEQLIADLTEQVAAGEAELERITAEAKDKAPKPRKRLNNFRLLMRRYVDKHISKAQQTSAWDDPVLSKEQRIYAAMDVAGLMDMRRPLQRDIETRGLNQEVARANLEVLDRSLRQLKSADACAHSYAQLIRTMMHTTDVDKLDRLMGMQGQMTIHHSFRPKIAAAYAKRRAELSGQPAAA